METLPSPLQSHIFKSDPVNPPNELNENNHIIFMMRTYKER